MWPLLTAVVVGGMISDDRQHGTSAIYFSGAHLETGLHSDEVSAWQ